jgi:hypothetical protein
VIIGVHALLYAENAEKVRAFLRDKLGLSSVDAGHGWLIFKLPPAELGIHPAEEKPHHELYLLCDDLKSTMAELKAKGVEFSGDVHEARWGSVASIALPGGGTLGMYQPKHPLAI